MGAVIIVVLFIGTCMHVIVEQLAVDVILYTTDIF
jgi:hypothetical protein